MLQVVDIRAQMSGKESPHQKSLNMKGELFELFFRRTVDVRLLYAASTLQTTPNKQMRLSPAVFLPCPKDPAGFWGPKICPFETPLSQLRVWLHGTGTGSRVLHTKPQEP